MMRRYIFIIGLFTIIPLISHSQSTVDSIKSVVGQLFHAMRNGDSALARNCFAKNAILQTIRTDSTGHYVKADDLHDFLSFLNSIKPGEADERIKWNKEILIDGPLASAWTHYEFYYKGAYSHCGVDSWQFLRTGSGWKIVYLIDTRRTVCTEK